MFFEEKKHLKVFLCHALSYSSEQTAVVWSNLIKNYMHYWGGGKQGEPPTFRILFSSFPYRYLPTPALVRLAPFNCK